MIHHTPVAFRVVLFLCILITMPHLASGADPLPQFFGPPQALGGATLSFSTGGPLVVGNIGSSGLDGVEVDLGRTRDGVGPIRWMAPESLQDRGMTLLVSGEDAAGLGMEFSCSSFDNGQGGHEVVFDHLTTGGTTVEITVYRSGNPLHQSNGQTGQSPIFESSAPPTGATAGEGEVAYQQIELAGCSWLYAPGTRITIPGAKATFVADHVRLRVTDAPGNMEALTRVGILGTEPAGSVGEMMITSLPGRFFGHSVGGVGQAEPLGIGSSGQDGVRGTLLVSNIGSSGQDGVNVALEDDDIGCGVVLGPMSPPVAGGKLFVGGLSFLVDDGSAALLPQVTCQAGDSFFDIFVDLATSSPPVSIDYLLEGTVVGNAPDPAAGARVHTGTPAKTSVQWPYRLEVASPSPTTVCVTISWDVVLQFTDGGGLDDDCDGVCLTFDSSPWSAFYSFDNLEIRGSDLVDGELPIVGFPNRIGAQTGKIAVEGARSRGSASLTVVETQGILVRDLRDGSLDGVDATAPAGSSSFGMTTQNRARPPFRGHVTVLKAYGAQAGGGGGGGGSGGQLGTLRVSGDDTQFLYAVDTSSLGPSGVTCNLYLGGALVASTICAGTLEECLGSDSEPVSFTASLNHPDGKFRMYAGLPPGAIAGIAVGAKGQTENYQVDLIEVIYDDPVVPPFLDVSDLSWQSGGAGELLITGVGEAGVSAVRDVPVAGGSIDLRAPSPNPFNPRTVVVFDLRRDAVVSLKVYDLRGNLVRNLYTGFRQAGEFREIWDGLDQGGRAVASGIYLVQLSSGGEVMSQKASLVR